MTWFEKKNEKEEHHVKNIHEVIHIKEATHAFKEGLV